MNSHPLTHALAGRLRNAQTVLGGRRVDLLQQARGAFRRNVEKECRRLCVGRVLQPPPQGTPANLEFRWVGPGDEAAVHRFAQAIARGPVDRTEPLEDKRSQLAIFDLGGNGEVLSTAALVHSGTVDGVATHPDHLQHGLGKRVMLALIEEARRRGYLALELMSVDTEAARRLYRAVGFHPLDDDGLLMSMDIAPTPAQEEWPPQAPVAYSLGWCGVSFTA